MRESFVISAVFHVAVLALTYFGLPSLFDRAPALDSPIPIEIVMVAEETRAPPPAPVAKEPPPEPKSEPVPQPKPKAKPEAVMAPPPPKLEAKPVEPAPKVAVLPPEPAPKPVKAPKPAVKPERKKVDVRRVPKPAAKPEPAAKFNPTRIAALLDKQRDRPEPPAPKADKPDPPEPITVRTPARRATSRAAEVPLTVSEIDFIKQQLRACWSVPAGVRELERMAVTIRIRLKPDGSLLGEPEVIDRARMTHPGEEFFRTFAESAQRAVRKCDPLRMPSKNYDRWRELELTFTPRDMVG